MAWRTVLNMQHVQRYIMGEKDNVRPKEYAGIYGYITSTGPPFTIASIAREQFSACTIFT